MQDVYLLLGSNLGNKGKFLENAAKMIVQKIGTMISRSSIYITEPWGFSNREDFYNQVLHVRTNFSALKVLTSCLDIEELLGRKRNKKAYEARTIDIDLLLYGNEIINQAELTVPHPQMHLRRFTLEPLCEIAPDLIHPLLKVSITQLLAKCSDNSRVEKLEK